MSLCSLRLCWAPGSCCWVLRVPPLAAVAAAAWSSAAEGWGGL
jgi:hypothetical protein